MNDILDDIQKYEMIEPVAAFKPLGPIANIEVQPVHQDEDSCSVCDIGNEDFWSVYVRYDPGKNDIAFGGVDCVADCSNFTGAAKLANLLGAVLGVEVVGI